jgi:hypothetical protein
VTLALEDRIARLEAIEAIRAQVARYAIAADRQNDPVLMAELFSEDATWEANGFGRHEGRDRIVAALAAVGREQMVWTTHYNVAPLVELDADGRGARCRWYLWELARMAEGGGHAERWIAGTYDARAILVGDAWLFSGVVLDLRVMTDIATPTFADGGRG